MGPLATSELYPAKLVTAVSVTGWKLGCPPFVVAAHLGCYFAWAQMQSTRGGLFGWCFRLLKSNLSRKQGLRTHCFSAGRRFSIRDLGHIASLLYPASLAEVSH